MHSADPWIEDFEDCSLNELARHVQAGHNAAFRYIVQRCNQRLFRVARGVLSSDADAEDALQDAYVLAYSKIQTFRGDAELSTWLTRIVLNSCYQRIRRQKHVAIGAQIDPFPTQHVWHESMVGGAMSDPAADASKAQLRDVLEDAISTLPAVYRSVFILRELEHYSTTETAEALGLEEATVRTRLFRARRALRTSLQTYVSAALPNTFQFLGVRCARLTDRVMARIEDAPFSNDK